jgi:aryl-alcohol dehydrogenase-like predicted oxidoreductase
LEARAFGRTGLTVSALGFGAGQIGGSELSEVEVSRVLGEVLELGITLIDTARGYGLSEERIGRHLASRRSEFVLSTKVGYGVPGCPDWTYECVRAGVDQALATLRTDVLDIVHLHSCPLEVLRGSGVVEALVGAVEAGKVRVGAYSGENEALGWAIESGAFGSIETSVSVCDQRVLHHLLPEAERRGLGVIAKRPVANAVWRLADRPEGDDLALREYWWRWKTMALEAGGLGWTELALRFAAFAPGVHTSIVGTRNPAHLAENAQYLAKGPLQYEMVQSVRDAFVKNDPGWWVGQV